jgi:hypothetical protein
MTKGRSKINALCILYLAVPQATYNGIFSEEVGELILRRRPELNLVIFDPNLEEITLWKH